MDNEKEDRVPTAGQCSKVYLRHFFMDARAYPVPVVIKVGSEG